MLEVNEKPLAADIAKAILQALAMDEDKWVTLKPHGKSVKGTRVRIDDKTNRIEAGAGGNLNGKTLSDLGKKEQPKSEYPQQTDPIDDEALKNAVHDIIKNDLDKVSFTSCVKRAARMAYGHLTCKLPGIGNAKVVVNQNLRNECCKYIRKDSDIKFVKSVLYGIANLPKILKTGNLHQWRDGGERHPGSEFCTVTKKFKMAGELFEVSIDVERNVNKKASEVHLVNTSFNQPYYGIKKRNLKPLTEDANSMTFTVSGIRIKFLK